MKTINFNDQELESMIMMYNDELLEAKLYVNRIEEILKKLSGKPAKEAIVDKRSKPKPTVKKPNVKPVKEKPEPKAPATVESVVGSLLTTAPKKTGVKKAAGRKKKSTASVK